MRAALSPGCPGATHWAALPRGEITSFDAPSMAYAFDYERYHFVVLHHSPRYAAPSIGVAPSLAWLARELAAATAQGRRVVLLLHAHKELGLPRDPTFARLIEGSNVVAIFYGHVHIRPWGLVGRFPNTSVPVFNCGASWYNVYCLAEFGEDALRVGVAAHFGDGRPRWFGGSLHSLPRGQRAKPVLEAFVPNPNVTTWVRSFGAKELRFCLLACLLAFLPCLIRCVLCERVALDLPATHASDLALPRLAPHSPVLPHHPAVAPQQRVCRVARRRRGGRHARRRRHRRGGGHGGRAASAAAAEPAAGPTAAEPAAAAAAAPRAAAADEPIQPALVAALGVVAFDWQSCALLVPTALLWDWGF